MNKANDEALWRYRQGAGAKVLIVLLLLIALGSVFYLKENDSPPVAGIAAIGETLPAEALPQAASIAPAPTSAKPLPRLLDLGADKCIPCKAMAPILAELKTSLAGQVDVEFIDVWKNSDASDKYNVLIIPTQIFYDADGQERFRHEGFYGKEDILAKWQELGVNLELAALDNNE